VLVLTGQTPEGTATAALVSIRVMHHRRYRVILPLVLGCARGLLMLWDLHNEHVIAAMGKAWDTGIPWPYHASWMAFLVINAPAYVLCFPVFSLLGLQTTPAIYPLLFPVAVVWWSWLGRRIDFGLLPSRPSRHRWLATAAFALSAVVWCYASTITFLDDPQWRWGYYVRFLHLSGTIGLGLWGFIIAVTLTLCAMSATRSDKAGR